MFLLLLLLLLLLLGLLLQVAALSGRPLLFAPQILGVLNFSPVLRNVVKAVRGPAAQLGM